MFYCSSYIGEGFVFLNWFILFLVFKVTKSFEVAMSLRHISRTFTMLLASQWIKQFAALVTPFLSLLFTSHPISHAIICWLLYTFVIPSNTSSFGWQIRIGVPVWLDLHLMITEMWRIVRNVPWLESHSTVLTDWMKRKVWPLIWCLHFLWCVKKQMCRHNNNMHIGKYRKWMDNSGDQRKKTMEGIVKNDEEGSDDRWHNVINVISNYLNGAGSSNKI